MEILIQKMLRLWDPYDLYCFPDDEYDSYAKRCADHGIVAQRKIAIFIVLVYLKNYPFLSKISAFLAKNLLFLHSIVFICFNVFLLQMWTSCGRGDYFKPMVCIGL